MTKPKYVNIEVEHTKAGARIVYNDERNLVIKIKFLSHHREVITRRYKR